MEQKIVKNTFFKFFFPALASSLMLSVISMTDLMIAGNFVGETALTTISLALPVIIYVQIVTALFGMGGAIVLSTCMGEGKREECNRIFTISTVSTLVISIVSLILGLLFLEPLILLLGGSQGPVMEQAKLYIGTLFCGMPFLMLSPVMAIFLRNDNEQKYAMFCVVSAGVGNILFSILFVTVFQGGIFGIALGTVVAELVCCILAGIRLFNKKRMFHLVRTKPDGRIFLSIIKPGLTLTAIFLSQILLTIVVNHVLCDYGGSQGMAVYAVIKYLINFLFAMYDGVTGAIQPMIGIYYGEKEENNIRYTVRYGFGVMFVIAAAMMLVMELLGGLLCGLFHVQTEQLIDMTVQAMRILGIYCLSTAVMTFMNAFYRCTGKEKISFGISLLDNLVFPIAFVLLFAKGLRWGTTGVWIGLLVAGYATMIVWLLYVLMKKQGLLFLKPEQFRRPDGEFHEIYSLKLQNMETMMADVTAYCDERKVTGRKKYFIHLVIEELVLNVVSMSKDRMKSSHYVDIRITPMGEEGTQLRIRDNLVQFNPADVSEGDAFQTAAEMSQEEDRVSELHGINTLGIGMVKKIAKDYSYRRTIGYNSFMVII